MTAARWLKLLWPGLVWAAGCAISAPINGSGPDLICFEHVGPENKPMPNFCVARANPTVGMAGSAFPAIRISPASMRSVLRLCQEATETPQEVIRYRVSVDRRIMLQALGRNSVLAVVKLTLDDQSRVGNPPPELLLRLQRRLAAVQY